MKCRPAYLCTAWLCVVSISTIRSLSQRSKRTRLKTNWISELQRCRTPVETLERICARLPEDGSEGCSPAVYSLVLVRLSRQLVSADQRTVGLKDARMIGRTVMGLTRVHNDWSVATSTECVEGTKATAIMARQLDLDLSIYYPLCEFWKGFFSTTEKGNLAPSAMTGLKWAMDTFASIGSDNTQHRQKFEIPKSFLRAYADLQVPFRILPSCLTLDGDDGSDTIASLVEEVDFGADTIQTSSTGRPVRERRWTAWQGDAGVAPFAYSGKSMQTQDWTPSILLIRNQLHDQTQQYYDGCLLNYYPNGESAMRYHRDPDQGKLWDYDTAVVSIGSPRSFSFRDSNSKEIHNFVVFHGDVTHMFADCQAQCEHTVKKADVSESARISLVFKKSMRCGD